MTYPRGLLKRLGDVGGRDEDETEEDEGAEEGEEEEDGGEDKVQANGGSASAGPSSAPSTGEADPNVRIPPRKLHICLDFRVAPNLVPETVSVQFIQY